MESIITPAGEPDTAEDGDAESSPSDSEEQVDPQDEESMDDPALNEAETTPASFRWNPSLGQGLAFSFDQVERT